MPFPLLAAAIGGAVKVGAAYLNKPKKSDYTADTTYLDKYVASLRGRQADREVYHMAMRPQLRQIGAQGRRMQRQVGYDVAKSGLEGSGIEAQQRLSAGGKVLESIQTAGEKATALQLQESRRLGEIVDQATMQKEQQISAANKAYQQAQSQWKTGMWQAGLSAVGGLAMGGLEKMSLAKTATEQTAFAKSMLPPERFSQMVAEGVSPADMYTFATSMQKGLMSGDISAENLSLYMNDLKSKKTQAEKPVVKKEPVVEETAVIKPEVKGVDITTAEQARKAGLKVTEPVQYKDITTVEQARAAKLDVTTAEKTTAVKAATDKEDDYEEYQRMIGGGGLSREEYMAANKANEAAIKKAAVEKAAAEKAEKTTYLAPSPSAVKAATASAAADKAAIEKAATAKKVKSETEKAKKRGYEISRFHEGGTQKEKEWKLNKEGERTGEFTIWHRNGKKDIEGTVKDGKREGLQTHWFDNGQKSWETTYKDGKPEGLSARWYPSGQKKSEGNHKDGKKDGLWTYWWESGRKKEETWKDGKMIDSQIF